jgi:mono/diheme cytochrome c family protein
MFFCLVVFGSNLLAEEAKEKQAQKDEHLKALFEKKCAQCHSADRIKKGHRTKEDLKQILERMKNKPGSNISAAESKDIENYIFAIMGDLGPPVIPGM